MLGYFSYYFMYKYEFLEIYVCYPMSEAYKMYTYNNDLLDLNNTDLISKVCFFYNVLGFSQVSQNQLR